MSSRRTRRLLAIPTVCVACGRAAPTPPPPPPAPIPTATTETTATPAPEAPCDNEVGTPGDCFSLTAPDAGSCSASSVFKLQALCHGLSGVFVPRVAEQFVACLLRTSGTDAVCDADAAFECAIEAMSSSCLHPETRLPCEDYVNRCSPPADMEEHWTLEGCRAALSSVSVQGRADALECMADDCDLRLCASQVF